MITFSGTAEFLLVLIGACIFYNHPSTKPDQGPDDKPLCDVQSTYDFIIVGGGTSGSVIAARLSEESSVSVLVVEAGFKETPVTMAPLLYTDVRLPPNVWQYYTTEQASACRATGGICEYFRPKIIGGSSSIIISSYVRGNRRDYDGWAAAGNPGWDYNSMLKAFKMAEDMRIPELAADTFYHSTGGPMSIDRPRFSTPLMQAFIDAGSDLGSPEVDLNAASQTGFSRIQSQLRDGYRLSSSRAYLAPAKGRCNLDVVLNATVTKINILLYAATGVQILKDGVYKDVTATRGVIVAAGAVKSAQLLQLSGIGPKEVLQPLGISVIKDLPVGYNLQEPAYVLSCFTINDTVSIKRSDLFQESVVLNYAQNTQGPITSARGSVNAFLNSKFNDPSLDYPDICLNLLLTDHPMMGPSQRGFCAVAHGIRPKSTGTVFIKSKNPMDQPLIDPNYFNDTRDLDHLVEAMRMSVLVSQTTTMQRYDAKFFTAGYPLCTPTPGVPIQNDTDYFRCIAINYSLSLFRPVGTCKMGPSSDLKSVVDSQLRVRGINRLMVVGGAAFPSTVSGNAIAPGVAGGENAASMIKSNGFFINITIII